MKNLYDREEIKFELSCGTYYPEWDTANTSEEDIDRFIKQYIKPNEHTISYKDFIDCLTAYREMLKEIHDDFSLAIVNKLIGDKKLFKKIVFTSPNAKTTNYISLERNHVSRYEQFGDPYFTIYSSTTGRWISGDDPRFVKKLINEIYRKYDVIFCKFPVISHKAVKLISIVRSPSQIYLSAKHMIYQEAQHQKENNDEKIV